MEQHPVPQNVTTFQFRLIGDMTIKQFGYLVGGAIVGYICYKLPLPAFFTWPLAAMMVFLGLGLAFMPIEDRPMDVWILSFIKSIYSPTEYVWHKDPKAPVQAASTPATTGTQRAVTTQVSPPQYAPLQPAAPPGATPPSYMPPAQQQAYPPVQRGPEPETNRAAADVLRNVFTNSPSPQQQNQTQPPLTNVAIRGTTVFTHKSPGLFSWIRDLFFPRQQQEPVMQPMGYKTPSVTGGGMDFTPPPKVVTPMKKPEEQIDEVKQKENVLEQKVESLKYELQSKSLAESRILELQKQLTEVLAEKNKMEAEIATMKRQQAAPRPAPVTPASAPTMPPGPKAVAQPASPHAPRGPTVKIITPEGAVKAGLPNLTTFPNVVTGIIKDAENSFLPGVLVTVTDKDTVPVRALKTNRLGQFAASTPLANGVYFVEIEDPRGRFIFDRVQITLNGSIVPALEIIAKSQREVTRAKLAQEIFGNNKPI